MDLWRDGGDGESPDRPGRCTGTPTLDEGPSLYTRRTNHRATDRHRMSLSLLDGVPRRHSGRPPAADDREQRLKHIRCAALLLSGQYPPKGVAAMFGVSRRTAYYWRDRALTYDDPEAEGLRRLAGGGRG
jgi:hypothetical protein